MRQKWLITALFLALMLACDRTESREVVEVITPFDRRPLKFLFRMFRSFVFNNFGHTSLRRKDNTFQEPFRKDEPFPCDVNGMKSSSPPKSIHKLRPGDINIIAALGDSLTAGSGAVSNHFVDLVAENRGLSWSIGGQWNWRNSTTLPNILLNFNPKLIGFSTADSFSYHRASQFNVATIGAVASDVFYMSKVLVNRIKQDPRVRFKTDWKMVSLCIGGNDFCTFMCLMKQPERLPDIYRKTLINALRYIRDNMPRTFINIVSTPHVGLIMFSDSKPEQCQRLHVGECSCWLGRKVTPEMVAKYMKIQEAFIQVEQEVSLLNEFRNLQEFAVVYQPFTLNMTIGPSAVTSDYSFLAYDCFHMSQKGHAWAGTTLWNNLLQRPGTKSHNWASPKTKFLCPTLQNPYFYTNDN